MATTSGMLSGNYAYVALGSMGGKARAAAVSKKRRAEIAKKAAVTRWKTKEE